MEIERGERGNGDYAQVSSGGAVPDLNIVPCGDLRVSPTAPTFPAGGGVTK